MFLFIFLFLSNITLNAINKTLNRNGAAWAGKWFPLLISNEGMNDVIKVIKSLEYSSVLIDGVTETVKHEIKKVGFLVVF